jgi:hypothetical protein
VSNHDHFWNGTFGDGGQDLGKKCAGFVGQFVGFELEVTLKRCGAAEPPRVAEKPSSPRLLSA